MERLTKQTLVIPGVNFKLLEEQRQTLIYIHMHPELFHNLGQRQHDDIEGLVNMLDVWSDT